MIKYDFHRIHLLKKYIIINSSDKEYIIGKSIFYEKLIRIR